MIEAPPTALELLKVRLTIAARLGAQHLATFINDLNDRELTLLTYDWEMWARPGQREPHEFTQRLKTFWMCKAGRGYGKTRIGAQFAHKRAMMMPGSRGALVAEDAGDARDVMIEGESGILAIAPRWERPRYNPSKKRLTWPNGSRAIVYSDNDPEALRGPQHHWGWLDEIAKWLNAEETWKHFSFGLRLGEFPQAVITTTPKPVEIVRKLMAHPACIVTEGTTYENRANLADSFFQDIVTEYEGTMVGRQELNGELLDPEETGIIKRSWFKLWPRGKPLPVFNYVVQSYDTAFTERTFDSKNREPDFTAFSSWGVFDGPRGGSVMLLDAWHEQMAYPNMRRKMKNEYLDVLYGPKDSPRPADLVLIENKGSGISVIQDLHQSGIPAQGYNPGNADKHSRLHAVSHLVEHGLCYVPEGRKPGHPAQWADPFISEVCSFPLAKKDDYTDTFSQMLRVLRDMGMVKVRVRRDVDEDEDRPQVQRQVGNPYAQ